MYDVYEPGVKDDCFDCQNWLEHEKMLVHG
jgi:hypothetical protein